MKRFFMCAVAAAFVGFSAVSASAQLFSYEVGEVGQPYTGNPGIYTVSTSTTTGGLETGATGKASGTWWG